MPKAPEKLSPEALKAALKTIETYGTARGDGDKILIPLFQVQRHLRALNAERDTFLAQGQADYRALHDALGWAHTDHGKPLPAPWRGVAAIISERDALSAELTEARATIARLTAAGQVLSEHADKAGGPAPGQCANPDPTTGPTCAERGCEGQTCQYPRAKPVVCADTCQAAMRAALTGGAHSDHHDDCPARKL